MTAEQYQLEVEAMMNQFGGYYKICAFTSNNTSECVKDRIIYAERHRDVVSCNDQFHFIDLFIKSIYKLTWVKELLDKVNMVCNQLHVHAKLKDRYHHYTNEFNKGVKKCNHQIQKENPVKQRSN